MRRRRPRKQKDIVKKVAQETDGDQVAAKKFAAAEAERAAHAQSDADKISALSTELAGVKQQQTEILSLLKQHMEFTTSALKKSLQDASATPLATPSNKLSTRLPFGLTA